MRVYDNGIYRDATPEEIDEFNRMADSIPKSEPTPEERLSALETENVYLKEALNLLLTGVTE